MYFKTLDKAECCGCTACFAACPKRCITMRSDEEGFLYPEIDKAACIECGLCERVCPFDHPTYANTPAPQVYASYVKDENQQVQSSSGGLFYAVSRWVIGRGGIVYGAASCTGRPSTNFSGCATRGRRPWRNSVRCAVPNTCKATCAALSERYAPT